MKSSQKYIPHIVVVGGGFAGIDFIKKLSRHEVSITLIDRNNYFTFTCLLYQVATAGLGPDAIAYPFRKFFSGYSNVQFRMAEVLKVDTETQLVETSMGVIAYDYLVIATGTSTNFYNNTMLQRNALDLKSIPQAIQIRNTILLALEKASSQPLSKGEPLNFFIVGAGPTGVELAGALAEIKAKVLPSDYPSIDPKRMHIYLLEASNRVLPGFAPLSSQKAQQYLEELGVTLLLNAQVKSYDGRNLFLNSGAPQKAISVIWSAGVRGNTIKGLHLASLEKANRYLVDEYLRIKPYSNIFAIGDIAYISTDQKYPGGHPMVAQVAKQQGKAAAANIIALINGKLMQPFQYKDLGSMATIGRHKAVMEVFSIKMQGFFAWIGWMFLHLVTLIGFRNKLVVLLNWMWNYFTYQNAIRIIVHPLSKRKETSAEHYDVEAIN